jgi:hypothetical protein
VFVDHNVKQIKCDIPKELTREVYLQVLTKLLAAVRREAYQKIKKILQETRREQISPDECEQVLEDINNTTQEEYRRRTFELYGIPLKDGDNPKRMMQKAYLVYSTISSVKPEDGTVVRTKWQDQISHEHRVHSDIMKKLAMGERVEGIEKDPL